MGVANRFARQLACGLAVVLLLAGTASAQRVEGDRAGAQGPYEAEVPVRSQSESEREAGFARALAQVFGKLSGDRSAASRPGVGQELRRAADYVDGYDYRQDESVGASGAPTFQTMLVVRFKQAEVDAVAGALGLPVWPTPRPRPVLWLAIDDGSGPRLVGLNQNNAARPVLNRAIERGFRLGLPAGNAAEQAAAGAIWRGDTAAIARLSARYNPPMQLLGKLYRGDGGWKADWIFVDNGRVLSRWSESHADARRAMATGADGAADALVRRYAKASPAGQQATQRIVFTGINSSADYLRLSAVLQRMSVVRGFRPVRAMPDGIEADLDLLTGIAGFRRVADADVLVEVEGGDGIVPMYRLR
ncbi:DUF2066 domain-containing protein [Luteimonas aestuarii]|uniref:DUF2066 domain-containing protein n=1 Tax=Luteimonas aestuarii TaxID=453837 RepID=A0A4R5U1I1_9GAMM|nr:DUF2066 domain-containing protein [Luteimonas aestuarii]